MRAATTLVLSLFLLAPALVRADIQCSPTTPKGSQARTKVKHRATPSTDAEDTSVADMITWKVPANLQDPQVRRANTTIDAREKRVFTVSGDLWRVKIEDNDCDFHLELSAPGGSSTDDRVIVEIPQEHKAIRNALIKAIKDSGRGDLTSQRRLDFETAMPITVTGLAFFDATHWSKKNPKKGSGHGTEFVATLWELHPVFSLTTTVVTPVAAPAPILAPPPAPPVPPVAVPPAPPGAAVGFVPPPCTLPFDAIKMQHPFDTKCGISGTGTDPAKLLQNRVKNNFCSTGAATPVSFQRLADLQHEVESPAVLGPNYVEPPSRAKLTARGEGNVVAIVAFLKEAHFADTDSGEGVNCKLLDAENNDIHIALVEQSGADECTSVTAEMSPHFRPRVWEASTPDPHSTPTHPRPPIPLLNTIKRPVLITGQLFFDASHHPCTPGHPQNPKRITSWEIHPVYSIRVCKHTTIAQCRANMPGDWDELDTVIHP